MRWDTNLKTGEQHPTGLTFGPSIATRTKGNAETTTGTTAIHGEYLAGAVAHVLYRVYCV